MKRILFYGSLAEGGIGKVMVDLINHLNQSKYEITVMDRFPGAYYSNSFKTGIKVKHNVPFKETSSKTYNHMVRVICDRLPRKLVYKMFVHKKYDIEIACDDSFSATLIGGSTNKNSKKILWEHMDVTKDVSTATFYGEKEIKEFFSPFDMIIGVSRECAEKFEEKYGFEEKLSYIYNPIDIENIEKMADYDYENCFKSGCLNIVSIGRFMPQKAFLRLIEVCRKLKQEGLKFRMVLLGEGPEKEKVESLVKEYRLAEEVVLAGYKDNPYPYIKNADLLLCASIHESYCLSVAESIVLGTPVISTECVGPNELLDYGKYGMLVDNSEDGLYEGLKLLIENTDLLEPYMAKMAERKKFFSLKECVDKWEEILDN